VFGFVFPYSRPHSSQTPKPATVEILNVELTPLRPNPKPSVVSHPEAKAAPDVPPAVSVARPAAPIEFAAPVAVPAPVPEARSAGPTEPSALPMPTRLTFGEGEGRQPAPDYPLRARREGQEGTVVVRFTVDENGSVGTADIVQSCPWPLLNDSAVNTVREQWHFNPGAGRAYEVAIRFKLMR